MRTCCSEWKELMTWPQEENGGPVAFTKDGKSVYVQSSLGYDTTRLLQVSQSLNNKCGTVSVVLLADCPGMQSSLVPASFSGCLLSFWLG